MALLDASALKRREKTEFTVDLGGGAEVLCRRPDLPLLVLQGQFPTPLLGEVIKQVAEWSGKRLEEMTPDMIQGSDRILAFLNTFVCASVVSPKVVLTVDEAAADPNAVWVEDLTLLTRKQIVLAVSNYSGPAPEAVAAAQTFPEQQSREGTGSDVPQVSPATV